MCNACMVGMRKAPLAEVKTHSLQGGELKDCDHRIPLMSTVSDLGLELL